KQPGEAAISIEVPMVTVDVVVTDKSGNFITGLKKDNFRILEDGVPQTITNFSPTDAPITMVMLMEFSKLGYEYYAYKARNAAYEFLDQRSEEHTSELQSPCNLVCRLLLEKKKICVFSYLLSFVLCLFILRLV